jgi:membrane protease YdiL (CAAX protease family)
MKSYPTYGQSIILLVIWLLCTFLSVLAFLPFFGTASGLGMSLMYSLSMVLTVTAGMFLRGDWKIAISPVSAMVVIIGILLILCLNVLLDPLTSLAPVNETLLNLYEGMKSQPIPFFVMAVIAAPLLEELMFRGIILDGYLKNYKPWHAILVSAFLFGLIHGNLAQGIGAFALGALFGWIYWKTQSIVPVVLLHFVNNGIAFIGTQYTSKEDLSKSLRDYMENDMLYFPLYALSALLLGALVWILQTKYFKQDPTSMPSPENEPTTTDTV